MSEVRLTFLLNGETKRTFKFFEVDRSGEILDTIDATIGTIYVKKGVFNGKTPPKTLTATLTFV